MSARRSPTSPSPAASWATSRECHSARASGVTSIGIDQERAGRADRKSHRGLPPAARAPGGSPRVGAESGLTDWAPNRILPGLEALAWDGSPDTGWMHPHESRKTSPIVFCTNSLDTHRATRSFGGLRGLRTRRSFEPSTLEGDEPARPPDRTRRRSNPWARTVQPEPGRLAWPVHPPRRPSLTARSFRG